MIISGMGMTMPYWDFMGSTMVTNDHIRLTPDRQSQQGSLWNSIVKFAIISFTQLP